MKRITGLGQFAIKGAIPLSPSLGMGFRSKERQRLAYEASRSVARLNAVLKKRQEAWDEEAKR
jgi:hypothetical protein